MANEYAITASADRVSLDASRRGQTTFTVSNRTTRSMPSRARVVTQLAETQDWFNVNQPERTLPPSETQQFTVEIAVPDLAAAGEYAFRLDVTGIENPDEEYAQGQSVVVVVPPPEVAPKRFPWWIFVVGGLVLLVALVALVMLLLGNDDDGDNGGAGVSQQLTPVIGIQPDEPTGSENQATGGETAATIAQGNVVLVGVAFLDLDAGSGRPGDSVTTSAGSESDIMVGSDDIEESMLEPMNDTLIGKSGASEPGAAGCAALSLDVQPVPAAQLNPGDYYCVRTSDGNLSQLRINDFGEGTGGFVFQIEVSWSTFAD